MKTAVTIIGVLIALAVLAWATWKVFFQNLTQGSVPAIGAGATPSENTLTAGVGPVSLDLSEF